MHGTCDVCGNSPLRREELVAVLAMWTEDDTATRPGSPIRLTPNGPCMVFKIVIQSSDEKQSMTLAMRNGACASGLIGIRCASVLQLFDDTVAIFELFGKRLGLRHHADETNFCALHDRQSAIHLTA